MKDAPVCVPAARHTLAAAGADTAPIADFLQRILGSEETGVGQLLIFTKPDCRSGFFTLTTAAARYGASRSGTADVYVGVGLRRDRLPDQQRGGNEGVVALLGVVADIDVAGPAHADEKKHYAPNRECAELIITLSTCAPTIVVDSGHGLQPWWLFEQPWVLTDKVEHERAARLSAAWQEMIAGYATTLGYDIDHVGDLARIMRVPGTVNRKIEPAVPVTVVRADGPRYTPEQLAAVIEATAGFSDSAAESTDDAGDLVLDPAAEPPAAKFEQLLARKADFRSSWERTRTDLKDSSASGYDMSVARFALNAGWTHQEVVNLLIASRRTHGDDLKLREDYYAEILRKVATSRSGTPSTSTDKNTREPSQAVQLLAMVKDIELFHTPAKAGYATFNSNGRAHTTRVLGRGSPSLRSHLYRRYHNATGRVLGSQALQDVLHLLDARAVDEGPEHEIFTRIASTSGAVYINLANDAGEVVEITPAGWQIITTSPVRFTRHAELAPLPRPVAGGTLRELQPFINVAPGDDWTLLCAFLVGCFGPLQSYPVLVTTGQQGSAKSTMGRVLKRLVDPAFQASTRSSPRDERDLVIAASRSHLLVYSNISTLLPWLSDALCRLSSGEGFATRELYTDGGEVVFGSARPVMLNGIEDFVVRGDLIDRSILITLPPIARTQRKTEKALWTAFDTARPRVLGALFSAVSTGLAHLPTTTLASLPRMADFATWVAACEPALGMAPGAFVTAYEARCREGSERALAANVIARVVVLWATDVLSARADHTYETTCENMLTCITEVAKAKFGEDYPKQRAWPKAAHVLSNQLRRLQPALLGTGIKIEFDAKRTETERLLRLTQVKP